MSRSSRSSATRIPSSVEAWAYVSARSALAAASGADAAVRPASSGMATRSRCRLGVSSPSKRASSGRSTVTTSSSLTSSLAASMLNIVTMTCRVQSSIVWPAGSAIGS